MGNDWRAILRWLRRARPTRSSLLRAVLSGTLAYATSMALFIGAPFLLVYSASHHHLVGGGTLAILLILIELLAFLRSPLRYVERMTSHDLGLRSVTTWRRWLTNVVGQWPFGRWNSAASGDLLERALGDTDALQDLWLRAVIPFCCATFGFVLACIGVFLWQPAGVNATAAVIVLTSVGVLALGVMVFELPRLMGIERRLRAARAARAVARLELQGAAAEIELLGRGAILTERLRAHNDAVCFREAHRDVHRHALGLVGVLAPLAAVMLLGVFSKVHSALSGRNALVVVLLAVAMGELLGVALQALSVVVSVSAAARRLDELEYEAPFGAVPWPQSELLDVEKLSWRYGDDEVLHELSITLAPGRRVALSGPNGSGKSTLLRLLARLEEIPAHNVSIGDCDLVEIDEMSFRRHLAYVGAQPGLLNGVVDQVVRAGRVTANDPTDDLRALGIGAVSNERWDYLSRGEAQRVALVRGLLDEPHIILLDEPTSGLGPSERDLVLAWLARHSATIIIATHDEAVVEWCDDHYELRDGALVLLSR